MSDKNTWELLKEKYTKFPHRKCINATEQQIKQAEEELELKFSDSYKFFLKNHETSIVGSLWIYTITRSEMSYNEWSVIEGTKWFKEHEKWPDIDDWYIICNNDGDPIGINTRGEVWISYHDSGFEQEKLADDFEEFAYKLLTETLW